MIDLSEKNLENDLLNVLDLAISLPVLFMFITGMLGFSIKKMFQIMMK